MLTGVIKKSIVRQYQGYSSPPLAAEHPGNFFGKKGESLPLFSLLKAIIDNGPILAFEKIYQELWNQVSGESEHGCWPSNISWAPWSLGSWLCS